MQEELERKSISVTVQAAKLTGRVMRAAVAAALRKIEKERTTPKVGRNSLRRLTAQTPDAHKIEVEDRIRSFERYAKKYKVRYHVEKDITVSPPSGPCILRQARLTRLKPPSRNIRKRRLNAKTGRPFSPSYRNSKRWQGRWPAIL